MILAILLLLACDDAATDDSVEPFVRDEALNIALTSEAGGASHRVGEPCNHCHSANGDGPGAFTASGSVYDADGQPVTGGAVALWAGGREAGALVAELPIDTNGNFYTTDDLGLPGIPVQPVIVTADGAEVNQMPWPTESASCNQCHTPGLRVRMP